MLMAIAGCTKTNPDSKTPSSSSSTGASQANTRNRIVLLINTDSPFWDAARAGVNQAIKDLKLEEAGYSAAVDSSDGTDQAQIEKLRQYGTQNDITAVVISPISSSNPAIADELDNLRKKGITVGCFDSDLNQANQSLREFYIGTNNVIGGKVLGTAAKALKAGGEYVQFVGVASQQNAIERMDGFASVYGEATQKDRKLDDVDPVRARDNVRDVIAKYPDLSVLVGIWSYNAPAIVDVVKEKNLRDKFKIVVFDAEPLAIDAMTNGQIDVMVVQNPFSMGYDSVKYIFAKSKNDTETIKSLFPKFGEPGGDIRDTGLKVVVPDANSPISQETFAEFGDAVQVMKLSDFQEWLKKNGLTGS